MVYYSLQRYQYIAKTIKFNPKNMPKSLDNMPKMEIAIISVKGARKFHAVPRVLKFGHVTVPAGTDYFFPQRRDLEFCFRLQGGESAAEDELDGFVTRTAFPHLFLKRPGVTHRYRVRAERRAQFVIYPASALTEFAAAGIAPEPHSRPFRLNPEVQNLLAELRTYESTAHNSGNPDRIDLIAFRLIMEVFLQGADHPGESDPHRRIRQIASQLESAPFEVSNIEELAARYGFSRRSFFRGWSELYALSPAKFLAAKRMEIAERLLQMGDLPICRIAETLHFSSASYFIQEFRRHFGESPAAYRKRLRNDPPENAEEPLLHG